jgi:hypothetical protein
MRMPPQQLVDQRRRDLLEVEAPLHSPSARGRPPGAADRQSSRRPSMSPRRIASSTSYASSIVCGAIVANVARGPRDSLPGDRAAGP